MITKKQWAQIRVFSARCSKKTDELHDHGKKHINRTVKFAKFIAEKEKANKEICIAAAMLHQIHDPKKVQLFLRKIKIEKTVTDRITECIHWNEMKRMKNNPKIPIEAKVIFDSDKLQVLGLFGFCREIASKIIRDGRDFSDAVKASKKLQNDVYRLIQTKTAQQIAKKQQTKMEEFLGEFDKINSVKL